MLPNIDGLRLTMALLSSKTFFSLLNPLPLQNYVNCLKSFMVAKNDIRYTWNGFCFLLEGPHGVPVSAFGFVPGPGYNISTISLDAMFKKNHHQIGLGSFIILSNVISC